VPYHGEKVQRALNKYQAICYISGCPIEAFSDFLCFSTLARRFSAVFFPLAMLSQYVFGPALFLLSLFIVLIILLQRGRGGGLTGALGGAGGASAFGVKAGDIFTRITAVAVLLWIVLCALTCFWYLPDNLNITADSKAESGIGGMGGLESLTPDLSPVATPETDSKPAAVEATPAPVTPAPVAPATTEPSTAAPNLPPASKPAEAAPAAEPAKPSAELTPAVEPPKPAADSPIAEPTPEASKPSVEPTVEPKP
jgi:preprotein translocase subunit SecG